jgi:hypothetical protein
MRKRFLALAVLALLILSGLPLLAQQSRGPSTPEERAKAVQFAHDLENNPFGPQAKAEREWLLRWIIEIPDITVDVCPRLLGPDAPDKKKHGPEILTQLTFSEAAFMIENPDKAKDKIAVHTAGLSAALKVYEVSVKLNSKDKMKGLDEVLARRDKGELQKHVEESMQFCTRPVA